MQKRIVIETERTHDPETRALKIRAFVHTLDRDLHFGYDPSQGEFENHAEAALALVADLREGSAITEYGEIMSNSYVFVTDLDPRTNFLDFASTNLARRNTLVREVT